MNTVSSTTSENRSINGSKTGRKADSPLSSSSSSSSSPRPTNSSSFFLSSSLTSASSNYYYPCFSSPVAAEQEHQHQQNIVIVGGGEGRVQENHNLESEEVEQQENHQSPCNIMRRHCSMNTSTGHTNSVSRTVLLNSSRFETNPFPNLMRKNLFLSYPTHLLYLLTLTESRPGDVSVFYTQSCMIFACVSINYLKLFPSFLSFPSSR